MAATSCGAHNSCWSVLLHRSSSRQLAEELPCCAVIWYSVRQMGHATRSEGEFAALEARNWRQYVLRPAKRAMRPRGNQREGHSESVGLMNFSCALRTVFVHPAIGAYASAWRNHSLERLCILQADPASVRALGLGLLG